MHLLYWGNAFKVCKGFTLGMNLSYLFGTLNTTSYAEYETSNTFNSKISNFRYLDGIHFTGGLQYNILIKEKHRLGFGLVYENALKVWSRENLMILNYMGPYSPILNVDTVLVKKDTTATNVKMPQIIGGGISYDYKDKILVAVDFTWQNWKRFSMSHCSDSLKNNFITELGVQYVPNPSSSKYYNKMNFRAGAKFATGYMFINDKLISEFALSLGLGLPIRTFNSRSSVNIMVEYGRLGTLKKGLILQNYYKLSFNFILQERWYQRRQLE
jgi:long-subunit fatty acid transport protein